MKILKIDGIKGLITTVFIAICAFNGFVIFPGSVAMNLWNKYLVNLYMFPSLELFQGVLLWGMLVTTYCILSKKGFAVSFKDPDFNEAELEDIIKHAKIDAQLRKMNMAMTKRDRIDLSSKKENVVEKEISSYVSSPISMGKQESVDTVDEEEISNIK